MPLWLTGTNEVYFEYNVAEEYIFRSLIETVWAGTLPAEYGLRETAP